MLTRRGEAIVLAPPRLSRRYLTIFVLLGSRHAVVLRQPTVFQQMCLDAICCMML